MAHVHGGDAVHEHGRARSVLREPFGIAQIVSLLAGIFFVATGAIALARGGIDSLTDPVVNVGGMGLTPLLAIIHLVVGVVCLAGATGRGAGRSACIGMGPFLVAAGVVALLQSVDALGWEPMNGVAYLAIGAIAIIAAMMTPAVLEEHHSSTVV